MVDVFARKQNRCRKQFEDEKNIGWCTINIYQPKKLTYITCDLLNVESYFNI